MIFNLRLSARTHDILLPSWRRPAWFRESMDRRFRHFGAAPFSGVGFAVLLGELITMMIAISTNMTFPGTLPRAMFIRTAMRL